MNFKPRTISEYGHKPPFLRDAKNVEYTVGNPVLDGTKFNKDTLVPAGTAIAKNTETSLYELVTEESTTLVAPVLTANDVNVRKGENEMVDAIRKASVREELLHGVTDAFKAATQGRIVYDI